MERRKGVREGGKEGSDERKQKKIPKTKKRERQINFNHHKHNKNKK